MPLLRKKKAPVKPKFQRNGSIADLEVKLDNLHPSFDFLGSRDYSKAQCLLCIPLVDLLYDTFMNTQTTPEARPGNPKTRK